MPFICKDASTHSSHYLCVVNNLYAAFMLCAGKASCTASRLYLQASRPPKFLCQAIGSSAHYDHEAHPRDPSRTIEHVSPNSSTFCRIMRTNSWRHLPITIRACPNRESKSHSVTTAQPIVVSGHFIAWQLQYSTSCRPPCTAAVSLQDKHAAMRHAP